MKVVLKISDIPSGVFNHEVIDLLKEYARSGECWINISKRRDHCFVKYSSVQDANEALKELNGLELIEFSGDKLKVKVHKKIQPLCYQFENHGYCNKPYCQFLHRAEMAIVEKKKVKKSQPKKVIEYTRPEPDYFRKAMLALDEKDVIKPKAEKEAEKGELSTSDSD